ncbi:hypothetical protein BGZ50_009468 [Haplosporangium sp. Z 11]|nr:hypothetical protein BGZ50_009468 [Haplosporangium sp. Z 11]
MFPLLKSTDSATAFDLLSLPIHEYFVETTPAQWTPEGFAAHANAITMDDYKLSLRLIGRQGRGAIPTFANEILRFLMEEEGQQLFNAAQQDLNHRHAHEQMGLVESSLSATIRTRKFERGLKGLRETTPMSPSVRALEHQMQHKKQQQDQKQELEPSLSSSSSLKASKKTSATALMPKSFFLDPKMIARTTYIVGKEDIGEAFYKFQLYGVELANDLSTKATMATLPCFLALNAIWDTSIDLDITSASAKRIQSMLHKPTYVFSPSCMLLMCSLDQELGRGSIEQIASMDDPVQTDIVDIFRSLRNDLPPTYFPFNDKDGEDSFVHKSLHALFSTIFCNYDKKWANKEARGSKERREGNGKEGLRPDLQIQKNGQTILFLEVKPPGGAESTYLADQWKLANLAKDEPNACFRKNIRLPFITTIQVFGHKMMIHTMTLRNGVYHFHQHHRVYVPRARDDAGCLRACLQALYSVKAWLQNLDLPPTYQLARSRPRPTELDHIKTTLITPTKPFSMSMVDQYEV